MQHKGFIIKKINSAVDFFFLFFLHGISIGTRQQGILYNVKTLGEEADLEAQTFSLHQKPIESTNVQFSTKPAFLPNVC
jgi:hypothetical protein